MLCNQFAMVLEKSGMSPQHIPDEWTELKGRIYSKHEFEKVISYT